MHGVERVKKKKKSACIFILDVWQGPKYVSWTPFIIYLGKYAFLWTFEIDWLWKACSKLTKRKQIRNLTLLVLILGEEKKLT